MLRSFLHCCLLLLFISTSGMYAQPAPYEKMFAFDSLKAFCVKGIYSTSGGSTTDSVTRYFNIVNIRDTLIDNDRYYFHKFGEFTYLITQDDSLDNRSYIYTDQKRLFADFGVDNGTQLTLALDINQPQLIPKVYTVSIDYIFLHWRFRKRMVFKEAETNSRFVFVEGFGLYESQTFYTEGADTTLKKNTIRSVLFNKSEFNNDSRMIINYTDNYSDKHLNGFPYTMEVSALISNKEFTDSFYVEYNVLRNGFLLNTYKFSIDTGYCAVIAVDPSMLQKDDLINFRVIYKDSSIFRNYTAYPAEGYVSFKVLSFYNNYFVLDSLKAFSVKSVFSGTQGGTPYSNDYLSNTYSVPDTIINGDKYFLYNFAGSRLWLTQDNWLGKKSYRYVNNEKYPFANFNVIDGETVILYPDGNPVICTAAVDSVFLFDEQRKRITFSYDLNNFPTQESCQYTYVEGIGLYSHSSSTNNGIMVSDAKKSIYSMKFISAGFNRTNVSIDSTNIRKDRYLHEFPCTMKVYADIDHREEWQDSFYVEFNVFRERRSIFTSILDIDSSNTVVIPYDSSFLKLDDQIKYKVVYKDTSIFMNTVTYPDLGYIIFDIVTETITPEIYDILLDNNYPNPFNPVTTLKYYLDDSKKVLLKIYDILGNEVAVLVDEVKPAGEYQIEFNASDYNLSSGIYLCKISAGDKTKTIKMMLLK
jgi:hypothetical protein